MRSPFPPFERIIHQVANYLKRIHRCSVSLKSLFHPLHYRTLGQKSGHLIINSKLVLTIAQIASHKDLKQEPHLSKKLIKEGVSYSPSAVCLPRGLESSKASFS